MGDSAALNVAGRTSVNEIRTVSQLKTPGNQGLLDSMHHHNSLIVTENT